MKIKTNLCGGVFFVVLGAILWLLIPTQIVISSDIPLLESAKIAPMLAIGMMVLCGLVLIIQSLVFKSEHIVTINFKEQRVALVIIGTMILYAALIYFVGYLIGTVVVIVLMLLLYKERRPISYIVLIIIGVLVYFLFKSVFHINLPGIGGVFQWVS